MPCPSQTFSLGDNHLTATTVSALVESFHKGSVSLNHLDLGNNPIGDEGVEALSTGWFPDMTELTLNACDIGDVGITHLTTLMRQGGLMNLDVRTFGLDLSFPSQHSLLTTPQVLILSENRIRDAGIASFVTAFAEHLNDLNSIHLSDNEIADLGMSLLSIAVHNGTPPELDSLRLGGNPGDITPLLEPCENRMIGDLPETTRYYTRARSSGVFVRVS